MMRFKVQEQKFQELNDDEVFQTEGGSIGLPEILDFIIRATVVGPIMPPKIF